jgi:RNA polymerase-interacting CarD/CdnL/TRCF family regulator
MRSDRSELWVPQDKLNDDWLRLVASLPEMQEALAVLGSPPKDINANPTARKRHLGRLKNLALNDTAAATAALVRDLWAFKKRRKYLSQTEEDALRQLKGCFLAEWSVCMQLPMDEVEQRFTTILNQDDTSA